ncbi:MAG: aminotransferase class V-fold PLP-dependent enzyme [Ignavibacteriae bacterium]|nr:MAG: aminotransferase class V-fold PLP-dependent enzyme [Ignavibacteriota bacterium]
MNLEKYFSPYRKNTVGDRQTFSTPFGKKRIVYADWTASGRLYAPIEEKIQNTFGPFVGNTHTETNITGTMMTQAYHYAHEVIKRHVNAGPKDALLNVGFGMTAALVKFQRMLGLKYPDQLDQFFSLPPGKKPVVFVTHMEHHSNHTSWYETIADVCIIPPTKEGLVDIDRFQESLDEYKNRPLKIGSFTACSNVTGIQTPYHQLAKIMHEHAGVCFIDFAASAPYVKIDMHPADPLERLDAIFFSPHKFLGGPGSSGVMVFDSELYHLKSPDQPGGGTILWTNPWGKYRYKPDIEEREDGGTPGFLQAIRSALAVELKDLMGVKQMLKREGEIVPGILREMRTIPGLKILADHIDERLGIISFYFDDIHYNLVVRILNDRFGIQVRGGCLCAGTYGHYLLHVDQPHSSAITERIDHGDLSTKPGWVRMSLHPTTTSDEAEFIMEALRALRNNIGKWEKDYRYNVHNNEFSHKRFKGHHQKTVEQWFDL